MQSTIFFRNFTNLDCAYIDDKGMVNGHSILLSCYMTGSPTSQESVVLDFSLGKKQLKGIIDDYATGLDHKLIILKDSNCQLEYYEDNKVKITSPLFQADLPANAIREIDTFGSITAFVNEEMNKLYPHYNLDCTIEGSLKGYTDNNAKYFSYSHGLKNSSSWGCQNPCHGHLSFVEVDMRVSDVTVSDNRLAEDIANYLDGAILIFHENIQSQDMEKITVGYETKDRGKMSATYHQPHKVLILKTETTIEYIIEHVREVFASRLKGKTLRISEGLQKGAQIYVD